MKKVYSWVKRLSITVLLVGFIIPVVLTWFTELASLEAASTWLHGIFADWASDAASHPKMAQWRTLLILGLPSSALLITVGGLGHLGERRQDGGATGELNSLAKQLEKFLLVYDPDYNFVGRLRKLVHRYDDTRFMEFRHLVYQCALEYCGPLEDGKETFLIMPQESNELQVTLSIVHEEVRQAVAENLLNIGACQTALHSGTPQLINNTERARRQVMTRSNWIVPECRSILVCPIQVGASMKGLIGVYHNKANAFTEDSDKVFLELMADLLAVAYTVRSKEVGE